MSPKGDHAHNDEKGDRDGGDADVAVKPGINDFHANYPEAIFVQSVSVPHVSAPSQADALIELASSAELSHAPDDVSYADININDHRETCRLGSKRFRRWLAQRFFEKTSGAPASGAMQMALDVIEARAQFCAPEREVFVRVGHCDGRLYVDLGDPTWRAIEIGPEGWRIVDRPPVRFYRACGMKALPEPVTGGSIGVLRSFLAEGLKRLPHVRLSRAPRMADFAHWATACETALWPAGRFMDAYDRNRQEAVEEIIEADSVAIAVRRLMATSVTWKGTASQLQAVLLPLWGGRKASSKEWPDSSRALAGRLRRAQTFLRTIGIELSFGREGHVGTRMIEIARTAASPTADAAAQPSSASSAWSAASDGDWSG
jgi:hypothetical protein